MNKKKTAFVASLLGAGVLALSAHFYRQVQEDKQQAQALEEVRAFFRELGEIGVVYVDQSASSPPLLKGGVVMEDGRVFLFENNRGMIVYEEESHA